MWDWNSVYLNLFLVVLLKHALKSANSNFSSEKT